MAEMNSGVCSSIWLPREKNSQRQTAQKGDEEMKELRMSNESKRQNRRRKIAFAVVGATGAMLLFATVLHADTILINNGDYHTAGNWNNGVPDGVANNGTIPEGKTATVTKSAATIMPAGGTLNIDGALDVSTNLTTGSTSLFLIKPTGRVGSSGHIDFSRTTVQLSGNAALSANSITLFGTGVAGLTVYDGTLTVTNKLQIGSSATAGRVRSLNLKDGTVTANELAFISGSTTPGAYTLNFSGTAGSAAFNSVTGLDGSGSYINFVSATLDENANKATLSVNGNDIADYQAWYANGKLRYNGVNSAAFNDVFKVSGSTLSVVPEPATFSLFGVAAAILMAVRRMRS